MTAQLIAQPAKTAGEFAVLIDGLGSYSRPISTKSDLAQKFFDQGLRLIYGYYSPEATASFREALRNDPENPMLHWAWHSHLVQFPTAASWDFATTRKKRVVKPLPLRTLTRRRALPWNRH